MTPDKEQELKAYTLSLPNIVSLFEVNYKGAINRFCADFRLEDVWWNEQQWLYLPLSIEKFRFSETNASSLPTLALSNVAALYSEALASLPDLTGATVTLFIVYAEAIGETSETSSDLYKYKAKFKINNLASSTDKQRVYNLAPIGYGGNLYAPSRVILREGLFNLSFPGAGEKYSGN